jgi:predicted transcriptional regulator
LNTAMAFYKEHGIRFERRWWKVVCNRNLPETIQHTYDKIPENKAITMTELLTKVKFNRGTVRKHLIYLKSINKIKKTKDKFFMYQKVRSWYYNLKIFCIMIL